jgi:hypothetical protein
MGGAFINGTNVLIKKKEKKSQSNPSALPPCERKPPSMNQKVGPHQTLNLPEK